MKRLTVIPIVALCGALAATSNNVAIARVQGESGAERVLTETLYDVSEGALLFPCSEDGEPLPEGEGEPIPVIEGFIAERFMSVDNPSGGVHYAVKTRPKARTPLAKHQVKNSGSVTAFSSSGTNGSTGGRCCTARTSRWLAPRPIACSGSWPRVTT